MNHRTPLPDEHPVWRLIGAWLAARQRGPGTSVEALLTGAEPQRTQAREDAARLLEYQLELGDDVEVDAWYAERGEGWLRDVDIRVRWTPRPDAHDRGRNAKLQLRRVVAEDGEWKIEALLDEDDRRHLNDPHLVRMLQTLHEERDRRDP